MNLHKLLIVISIVTFSIGLGLSCLLLAVLSITYPREFTAAATAIADISASPTAFTTQPTAPPEPTEPPTLPPEPTEPPTLPPKPTKPPTPPPKPSVGRVGERREAGGIALTVTKVSKLDQIGDFWKPGEGNIYLVTEVIIENVNREEAPYNPLYFKVKDSDGFEYLSAITAPDPSLKSGTLAKGDKVRGNKFVV